MPENPFNQQTPIEQSLPKANEKLVAELLSEEDAVAYATLNQKTAELLTEDMNNVLTEEEGKEIVKARRVTPEEIIALLKESGSKAELDTSFEGGIVSIDIPPDITDWATAAEAFKAADNGSPSHLWQELGKDNWTQPEAEHLDIIVLSYNNDPSIRQSSEAIVADMEHLGLRPLTVEEMLVAAILEPKFTKSDMQFVGLTQYWCNFVFLYPRLWHGVGGRGLVGSNYEWGGENRFLCVRK